jgi:hypothetical protein
MGDRLRQSDVDETGSVSCPEADCGIRDIRLRYSVMTTISMSTLRSLVFVD